MLMIAIEYGTASTNMHTARTVQIPHTSYTSPFYRRGGCSDCTTSHVPLPVIVMWSCTAWVQSLISQIGVTWLRHDSLLVCVLQCHKHCYTPLISIDHKHCYTPLISIETSAHSYSIHRFTLICTTIIILAYNYNIISVTQQLLHMRGRYSGFGALRFAYAHSVFYSLTSSNPSTCLLILSCPSPWTNILVTTLSIPICLSTK